MTTADSLEKASCLNLALVQICDNLPLDRLSEDDLDAFERRAAELGIGVEVGTRGIDPHNLRAYIRLAE